MQIKLASYHVLQCVAMCCNALQCVAMCCSVLLTLFHANQADLQFRVGPEGLSTDSIVDRACYDALPPWPTHLCIYIQMCVCVRERACMCVFVCVSLSLLLSLSFSLDMCAFVYICVCVCVCGCV